jgi:hypothetical protein
MALKKSKQHTRMLIFNPIIFLNSGSSLMPDHPIR